MAVLLLEKIINALQALFLVALIFEENKCFTYSALNSKKLHVTVN